MGRKVHLHAIGPLLVATAIIPGLLPSAGRAEDQRGTVLTFDLSEEFNTRSNPGLDTPPADRETLARTHLEFGLVSATDAQRLSFALGGTLEAGKGHDSGLSEPHADFSYRRESAASALEISAFLRDRSVDTLDFVLDSTDSGPIITAVEGTGTQRQTGGTTKLEFGRDASVGATLSLGVTDTTYVDTTDTALVDNRRETGQVGFRYDLSPALSLTSSVSLSRRTDDGSSVSEDSSTLNLGLRDQRPDGYVDVSTSFSHTESGNRQSLSFGRSRDLPLGNLTVQLGVAHGETGSTDLIGGLDWQQDFARGKLALSLDRSVADNDNDVESRISQLSLYMLQTLTPRLSGSIHMGLQDSTETVSNASNRTAELTASLNYDLTQDWGLQVGTTHRERNRSTGDDARSTDAFVSLSRHFEYRP